MSTAAMRRWVLGLAFSLAGALTLPAADAAARGAPSRPGASAPRPAEVTPAPSRAPAPAPAASPATSVPPALEPGPIASKRIGGVDCVSVADVAARLGLKLTAGDSARRVTLSGNGVQAQLEADERDSTINGLRVFLGYPAVLSAGVLYVSRVDYERCLTPLLRPGAGQPPRAAPKTIVLDPGHGGRDFGKTTSVKSSNEKTFTLDVARRAQKLLAAAGYTVVLTRDDDTFIDLAPRAAIANANHADLFVSIHFNALANDTRTSGVEVFNFAPRFQRSTVSWSPGGRDDTENEAAPVNRFDHWSVLLAQSLQRRFVTDLKTFDRGRKLAHWGVLRGLTCPGILIECGFLTSETEIKKIATPEYRQQLAESIAAGIRDYATTLGTARANASR